MEPGVSFFLPPRGFFGCGGAAAAGEGDTSATGSAGPGPGRFDVGGNLDGSLNAKTQESSELDAETEWSKHNKGLLDDLGLD